MLFKNFNDPNLDFNINEGNFISSDWTGFFDTDAEFRLNKLTIDKLFEGLDIEKSEAMHNFIKSIIPSLSSILGKDKSTITNSFEFIRSQVGYIQNKVQTIEKELAQGFQQVLDATKTQGFKKSVKKVSEITSPSGISSVIPKIDEVVKMFKKSGSVDFKSEALRQSFISLYNVDLSVIIKQTLASLEQYGSTVGLKALYTKIDAMDLQKIESDSASSFPAVMIGSNIDLNKMLESTDVYDRFSSFFELVMLMFPYTQRLKEKFGENYGSINLDGSIVGPDAIQALKQSIPSTDISVFEPLSTLLNEVSSILIKRVFSEQEEIVKNIFTPSLQVMFMCMVVILALKLINLNIEVEMAGVQKEEELKKEAEAQALESKKQRALNLIASSNELSSKGFYTRGGLVYKSGSQKMSSDMVKLINNFLVYMNALPPSKLNDSYFDKVTEEGVKKFQAAMKAKLVDGMIGNETKSLMQTISNRYAQKYQNSGSITGSQTIV
jgi:hypothetical protein